MTITSSKRAHNNFYMETSFGLELGHTCESSSLTVQWSLPYNPAEYRINARHFSMLEKGNISVGTNISRNKPFLCHLLYILKFWSHMNLFSNSIIIKNKVPTFSSEDQSSTNSLTLNSWITTLNPFTP